MVESFPPLFYLQIINHKHDSSFPWQWHHASLATLAAGLVIRNVTWAGRVLHQTNKTFMEEIRLEKQQPSLTTLITLATCWVTSRFRLDISKIVKTLNYRSTCQDNHVLGAHFAVIFLAQRENIPQLFHFKAVICSIAEGSLVNFCFRKTEIAGNDTFCYLIEYWLACQ